MKNTLYFYHGGFRGPSIQIEYKKNNFEISFMNQGSIITHFIKSPSKIKWDNFFLFLDNIKIWEWKKEYVDPNILDGTQWEIEVSNSSKKIKSCGSNKFPNKKNFKGLMNEIETLFNLKELKR